jgi:hypothetical protein
MSDLALFDGDAIKVRMYYADQLSKASMLPDHLRGKPANVLLVLELGRSLGIDPIHALSAISVVKGKPTMSAELMRALVLRAGHRFRIVESSQTECTIDVARHEYPDDVSSFAYTMSDAEAAGLAGSDTYKRHPKAMLLARCTTMAARAVFPDVIAGISYTPDELDDPPQATRVTVTTEPDPWAGDPVDVTDAEIIDVDDALDNLEAAGIITTEPAPPAPVDVGNLHGPAARAATTALATPSQLAWLERFAKTVGFDGLGDYLNSPPVRGILHGEPSSPLLKAHASTLIDAAKAFEASVDAQEETR